MTDNLTGGPTPDQGPEGAAQELARRVAGSSGIARDDDGQIDVLKTLGGTRGLVESLLPGLVFLVVFTLTQRLNLALGSSLAMATAFTLARLVRKSSLSQALTGLAGVVICALFSRVTGNAKDYYVPGFYSNAAYAVALIASTVVRWPLVGVLFGFIRDEGIEWRQDPRRMRVYTFATWAMVAVFLARLFVQLPLYFVDNVPALGAARLVMGIPLYAGGLWLAWMLSRPQPAADRGA